MREFTRRFERPVDLRGQLASLDVEFLEVDAERLIVLYRGEVVQLTITDGNSHAVREVRCRVLVTPRSTTSDWNAYIARLRPVLAEPVAE